MFIEISLQTQNIHYTMLKRNIQTLRMKTHCAQDEVEYSQ